MYNVYYTLCHPIDLYTSQCMINVTKHVN